MFCQKIGRMKDGTVVINRFYVFLRTSTWAQNCSEHTECKNISLVKDFFDSPVKILLKITT